MSYCVRRHVPLAAACSLLLWAWACTEPTSPATPSAIPIVAACVDPTRLLAIAESSGATKLDIARRYLDRCGREPVVQLTGELVRFATVRSKEPPVLGPAFGQMAAFLDGWATENRLSFARHGGDDVWELRLGNGPPRLAFVFHADVVPAGDASGDNALPSGWTHPPFAAELVGTGKDRLLYGRGTEDDKGPIAALMLVMSTLRRLELEPQARVQALLGTGEESDWSGMRRYAEHQTHAPHTISVDSNFPLVTAQSGFVAWHLGIRSNDAAKTGRRVTAVRGGEFLTQIPGEAVMTVGSDEPPPKLLAAVEAAVAAERVAPYEIRVVPASSGAAVTVTVIGVAVHSSTAEEGHNALWPLAGIAERLGVAKDARGKILALIAERFAGDHHGEKLGLAYEDPFMGELLVAPTVLRDAGGEVRLSINMRRPAGRSNRAFGRTLDAALVRLRKDIDPGLREVDKRYIGDPFVAATDGALVTTLRDIYRQRTGDEDAEAIAIRGGTYARLFPGAVDFGPALPGHPYRGHAPDEYIEVDTLHDLTLMLFEAVVRLGGVTQPPGSTP